MKRWEGGEGWDNERGGGVERKVEEERGEVWGMEERKKKKKNKK